MKVYDVVPPPNGDSCTSSIYVTSWLKLKVVLPIISA